MGNSIKDYLLNLWDYNNELEEPLNIQYVVPVIGSHPTFKHFYFTANNNKADNYKDRKEDYIKFINDRYKENIFILPYIENKDMGTIFFKKFLLNYPEYRLDVLSSPGMYGSIGSNIPKLDILNKEDIVELLMSIKSWSNINSSNISEINALCKNKKINRNEELEIIKNYLEKEENLLTNSVQTLEKIENCLEKIYTDEEIEYLTQNINVIQKRKEAVNKEDFLKSISDTEITSILKINNIDLMMLKNLFNIPAWNERKYEDFISVYTESLATYDIRLYDFQNDSKTNLLSIVLEFESDKVEYNEKKFKDDLFFLLNYYKKNYKTKYDMEIISTLVLENSLKNTLSSKNTSKSPVKKI